MKIAKKSIRLVEAHPSLLLDLTPQDVPVSPVIIDQNGVLVDGYRRLQVSRHDEIDAAQVEVEDWFSTAAAFNTRTRAWDDIDRLLWTRLARSVGAPAASIPGGANFPGEILEQADASLLRLLARRQLQARQVTLLLRLPEHYREFFAGALSEWVTLNANETGDFIDIACDLKKMLGKRTLKELFETPGLAEVVGNQELSSKQRGEWLLKRMRILRYPKYQEQAERFSSGWSQLHFGHGIRPNKNFFLQRGVLEMTVSSSSLQELRRAVEEIHGSLDSPAWEKIWELS